MKYKEIDISNNLFDTNFGTTIIRTKSTDNFNIQEGDNLILYSLGRRPKYKITNVQEVAINHEKFCDYTGQICFSFDNYEEIKWDWGTIQINFEIDYRKLIIFFKNLSSKSIFS